MIRYKYKSNSRIYKAGKAVEDKDLSALPVNVIANAIRQGTVEEIKDKIIEESENIDILEAVYNTEKEVKKIKSKKSKNNGS